MNELEGHEAGGMNGAQSAAKVLDKGSREARSSFDQATASAKDALRGAKQSASDSYNNASSSARGVYETASRKVAHLRRHAPGSPEEARRAVVDFADGNPAMVAVLGIAAGLIIGALLPGTSRENQVFGRYADDVKDQGLRYARDLAEQGRQYVEESFEAAKSHSETDG